jgi:hypothetical protein
MADPMIERVDGQTVASHPLSENRIRDFLKWDNGSRQGGIKYEIHCAYQLDLSFGARVMRSCCGNRLAWKAIDCFGQ